jgi:hypothetical protein
MCEIEHGQCNDWGEDTTAKEYESKTNTTKKGRTGRPLLPTSDLQKPHKQTAC